MAMTPSNMMALGTRAPEFRLLDAVSGNLVELSDVRGQLATLVMFICNHCPYVKHIEVGLEQLGADYQSEEVGIVAISSNDVIAYPQDGPEEMKHFVAENHFNFPYLFDDTQEVAKAYDAACTPDFFLFDSDLHCVYRGRFDGARPKSTEPVTGVDIRKAIDATINRCSVEGEQIPSVGCNIKWRG
ncbi:MAG: thioredoxin family protein [Halieaceae bacterium]|nr:thioredoxin family protein [Halieaceae bacterium]